MRDLINWKDHVVEFPNRFTKTESGGYVTLEKAPGTVKQPGTPMNATNLKNMDLAALEAMLMASENTRNLIHMLDSMLGIQGEVIETTLTNTQEYPFNNSQKTLQLTTPRNTKDYTVTPEVVSVSRGAVGDFEISDKLLNGFKIRYTGSADSVTIRCYVRGGI